MKALCLVSIFLFESVLGSQASVKCETSIVDAASPGAGNVTAATCQETCKNVCGAVHEDTEVTDCLKDKKFQGCLVDIQQLFESKIEYCQPKADAPAGKSLIFSVPADTLKAVNAAKRVERSEIRAKVSDITGLRTCAGASSTASIGINTAAFSQSGDCVQQGSPAGTAPFSIVDDSMVVEVTEVLRAAYGVGKDVSLFVTLTGCNQEIRVRDANLAMTLMYQDGFRENGDCYKHEGCLDCELAGCTWCSWNEAKSIAIPDWLPDWSWIEGARAKDAGKCGLNSAVCSMSLGKSGTCDGAFSLLTTSALGLAAALVTIFLA